jgi:D-alanine-D-alanine ligase
MSAARGLGKVAVLMGGSSAEREISLMSGTGVLAALRGAGVDAHAFDPSQRDLAELRRERFARCFIALHGRGGEDGALQGALELLGIPYTGSGVLGSALAMDKLRAKLLWRAMDLPTPPYEMLEATSDWRAAAARLGLPLMVKPVSEGSSIGMSKVREAGALEEAYALAVNYDRAVMAEKFIEGIELTGGILGDEVLPLIRLETPRDFYDYQAKYFAEDTRYLVPCGLEPERETALRALCLKAFRALGCGGWGRVDLMLDRAGDPYLLEVNTAPGMTGHSLVPMAAKAAGLSFAALCVRILELAHVA